MSRMLTNPQAEAGAPLLAHTSGLQTLEGQKKPGYNQIMEFSQTADHDISFPSKVMKVI